MPSEPPAIDEDQEYPYPFRRPGDGPGAIEVRYERRGKLVVCHRWTWSGGTARTGFEELPQPTPSVRDAKLALRTWVKGTLQMGYAEVRRWPEAPEAKSPKPARRQKRAEASGPKADPPFEHAPLSIGKLSVRGARKPATGDAITKAFGTALPPSYADLLARIGPGAFVDRLCFEHPAQVVKTTRKWRKLWKPGQLASIFLNCEELLGDRTSALVWIGRSIDGDSVCFLAGAPDKIFVLPRTRNVIDVEPGIAGVLGYFLAKARNADGRRVAPRYQPGRRL